ncbi:hypothetical protein [Microvirga vignae]|uniref:hypothetical protein n=1 Tax=Microvirga vignae TaxID=1225564 RepID=UPI001AEBB5A6|nr:hypothetical protein [Microvirga vignae]
MILQEPVGADRLVLARQNEFATEPINLTGTYAWGEKPTLIDSFRPLRQIKASPEIHPHPASACLDNRIEQDHRAIKVHGVHVLTLKYFGDTCTRN